MTVEELGTGSAFEERYLGDGVYASFDGYHIILDLRAQDDTTRIALEPQVLESLRLYEVYVDAIRAKLAKEQP